MSLSDKIAGCESEEDGYYEPEDVKIFIEELKDNTSCIHSKTQRKLLHKRIDKLAGDKLV